jgi:type VI protein secretion system component VasF
MVVRPVPPRRLPPQDHAALDAAERTARRVTLAVAAVAGMVALVVACVLAGSLLR